MKLFNLAILVLVVGSMMTGASYGGSTLSKGQPIRAPGGFMRAHGIAAKGNAYEYDCRVLVRKAARLPTGGAGMLVSKVCPYKDKLAAGKCEFDLNRGMRCIE